MAADLAELMSRVGMPTAVVVGSSLGGGIAIDVALERPEVVRGLVLAGAWIRGREQSAEAQRADAEIDALVERGDLEGAVEAELRLWLDGPSRPAGSVAGPVRDYVRDADRANQRRAEGWKLVKSVRSGPPPLERLEEITAPTLVVVGDHDLPDLVDCARELADRIPSAELVVMHGTAHLPSLEQPAAFTAHLTRFLERLDDVGR